MGDILGRYIDANGRIVDPGIDTRARSNWSRAAAATANRRSASGAGLSKRAVALARRRAGQLNALVTDEKTALFLLEEAKHG